MRYIVIPVEAIKKYKKEYKKCIGFESTVFVPECNHIINVYCAQDDKEEWSDEYKKFIAIPPLSEERIPFTRSDEAFEFALKIAKRMFVYFDRENLNELWGLWEKHHIEDNEFLKVGMLLLIDIYEKYKEEPDFGWNDYLNEMIGLDYTYGIRYELLKLYCYLHKQSSGGKVTIQLDGGEKLVLDNTGNWFNTMSMQYLNKRLDVSDMNEALQELQDDYSRKKGRKQESPEFDIILMGCYNLLRHAGVIPPDVLLTDKAANIIIDFLKYLGFISNDVLDDKKDDVMYIRAKVRYLRETGFKPVWYRFPNMKEDPEWEEIMQDFRGDKNDLPTVSTNLHPILTRRMMDKGKS